MVPTVLIGVGAAEKTAAWRDAVAEADPDGSGAVSVQPGFPVRSDEDRWRLECSQATLFYPECARCDRCDRAAAPVAYLNCGSWAKTNGSACRSPLGFGPPPSTLSISHFQCAEARPCAVRVSHNYAPYPDTRNLHCDTGLI